MTPPRVAARGMGVGGRFCGASGAPPLRVARERAVVEGRGGVGAPRPTYRGDMETLWGLREQSFPGRRAVGAGHARPGGLRRQASMVRSVGRGLDPSAGVGGSGRLRGWLPGDGRRREPAPHPALRGHLPPRGRQGLLLAAAQASAGRRGRRPLRVAREWAAAGACPSSGPAGPPSPEGEGKGCMAAAGACPYPGSWSSVRSWRVRL